MAAGRKTGGRQKGVPNKQKAGLLAMLAERWPDYHPVVAMADIANDAGLDLDLRFQAHKEVAQYIEPKRKAVEHSGPEGGPMALKIGWLDD